ncbi:MAG: carboxypeptidase-like regulatory domain-containing protein [Pyrinomonadaceae bacterium]
MTRNIRLSNTFFYILTLMLAAFSFAGNASAQFETATVLGSVRDANEAVIEGAAVTLKNVATDITSTAATDSNGDYQFVNIKIGIYQITIEANGFNRTVAENINVTVNARQRVDLTLQVATATETVVR